MTMYDGGCMTIDEQGSPPRGDGGRGKKRMIEWNGDVDTVGGWALRFGVSRAYLYKQIAIVGEVAALEAAQVESSRSRPRTHGPSSLGAVDMSDVKMSASSIASAVREFSNGSRADAVANIHLAYRFLRGVLRRNRYPLNDDEE